MENKQNCKHKNKVYAPVAMVYMTYPRMYEKPWICQDCGFEDVEVETDAGDMHKIEAQRKYDETKAKFSK